MSTTSTPDEDKPKEVHELAENPLKGEIIRIAKQVGYSKLTDDKINWLAVYLTAEPDINDTEIAHRAGLEHSTPIYWRRDEQWIELVWRVAITREIKHLPKVWKAVRMKAERGDIAAARLYTMRYDPVLIKNNRAGQKPPDDNLRHDEARKAIKQAGERQRIQELKDADATIIDVTPNPAACEPTETACPVESSSAGPIDSEDTNDAS